MKLFFSAAVVSAFSVSIAAAAPTDTQVCSKMIADGRGNGLSVQDCKCMYRVADAVLDDDLKALLFEAWYTGKNNMDALESLPNPRRFEKQMRTMERTLAKYCPDLG